MCVLTGRALFRWPFSGAKFSAIRFIMRVGFSPTIMVSTADGTLLIFTLNCYSAGPVRRGGISSSGTASARSPSGRPAAVLVVAAPDPDRCADLGAAPSARIDARWRGAGHRFHCLVIAAERMMLVATRRQRGDHRRALVSGFLFGHSSRILRNVSGGATRHADLDHQPARGGHRNHQSRNVRLIAGLVIAIGARPSVAVSRD